MEQEKIHQAVIGSFNSEIVSSYSKKDRLVRLCLNQSLLKKFLDSLNE